jgi:hypothetical protein
MNILYALALTFAVSIACRHLFDYQLPGFGVLTLYLLFYWLVGRLRRSVTPEEFPGDRAPDRSQWPVSGPWRHLGSGPGGIIFSGLFLFTNMLSMLNPFQLIQLMRQLIGNERLQQREKKLSSHGVDYQTTMDYRLPFRGEWLLFNGGLTPKTSHSWNILGQRFALDFVQADADFCRHRNSGTRPEDYFGYGQEILAAADGKVVHVENRIANAPLVGWGMCDFTARSFVGNHVVIQHAEHEYALYAHLIKGSVCVNPGDSVTQGQVIGQCGNTGHSSEPHLHFHLQDSANIFQGLGLPIRFGNIKIDRQRLETGYLSAGQRVENA